jgi:hypothetical protein
MKDANDYYELYKVGFRRNLVVLTKKKMLDVVLLSSSTTSRCIGLDNDESRLYF